MLLFYSAQVLYGFLLSIVSLQYLWCKMYLFHLIRSSGEGFSQGYKPGYWCFKDCSCKCVPRPTYPVGNTSSNMTTSASHTIWHPIVGSDFFLTLSGKNSNEPFLSSLLGQCSCEHFVVKNWILCINWKGHNWIPAFIFSSAFCLIMVVRLLYIYLSDAALV